jgi:pimeloyl-ACP methyl ester carboxylesterase
MADRARWLEVACPGGRSLEVLVDAEAVGMPLVYHCGTPIAAVWFPQLADAAANAGLRLVSYSRPGYAGSTPMPGRSVADAAGDVAGIVEALNADEFVALGWSGGGPHALACAALLAGRCAAAATIAGVAPYPAEGLDWMANMGQDNVDEFSAAFAGAETLEPLMEKWAADKRKVQGPAVAEALGNLVSDVDKSALTGEFAEMLAECFHRSVSTGIAGWRDDDLAFTRAWGFDLGAIQIPVAIWQGGQDRMVPFAHGAWLAQHIPGAQVHFYPDEGHLSLAVASLERIVTDLAALGKAASATAR